ncbi:MAG: ATP-binding protein [Candidatus Dojkabacteria bacterium]
MSQEGESTILEQLCERIKTDVVSLDPTLVSQLAKETVTHGESNLVAIIPQQPPFIYVSRLDGSWILRSETEGEDLVFGILAGVFSQKLESLSEAVYRTAHEVSDRLMEGNNTSVIPEVYEQLILRQQRHIMPAALDLDRFASAAAGYESYLGIHSGIVALKVGDHPHIERLLKNSPHILSTHVHKLKGTASTMIQLRLSTINMLIERKPDMEYDRILMMLEGNTTKSLMRRAAEPETDHGERAIASKSRLVTALTTSYQDNLLSILTLEIGAERSLSLRQLRQVVSELSMPYEGVVDFQETVVGDLDQVDGLKVRFPVGHEQITIQEIIQNAVDHSPVGGKQVNIIYELDPSYGERGSLHVSIIDNGRGMNPRYIEYFNLHNILPPEAISQRYGSTGTGLSRIRRELKEIGGWMYLKPGPGGNGLAVCMHLPIVDS